MPGGELNLVLDMTPPADADADADKNWVVEEVYDEDGNVVGASKQFFDKLGRPTQSQVKNIAEGHVFASQRVYDMEGLAAVGTLPAPIFNSEFNYKEDFITNPSGETYSFSDFDLPTETGAPGEVNNPKPVGLEDIGTLGWYYSYKNNLEPFTAVTTYPYSRSWTETGPDPSSSKSAGPGDQLRMGTGKEVTSTKERISNNPVLNHYYAIRDHFVTEQTVLENKGEGYKITNKDPNGKQSASYINASGQPVVTEIYNGTGYDYSYGFYDGAGNMVATVAPEGVNLSSTAAPSFVTTYAYNQVGWLLSTTSPDEGTSQYVYSNDGKLRFSQNEEQRASSPARFSYTNYDNIGRLIESGEYTMSGSGYFIFEPHSDVTASPNSVHTVADKTGAEGALDAARCSDVTKMYYDLQTDDFPADALHPQQYYLYHRVAKTENENTKTWYSYDEFGQLVWMKQEIYGLGIKTVDYTYDYFGNVLEVAYQKGGGDAFYHHYSYDQGQRLHQVFTSKDGGTKKLHATYEYYLHGPLKRVELAEGLQGTDYVYTVNGSLKTINHADPAKDPGQDGSGVSHADVAEDVFGMTVAYYEGDYKGAEYDAGELSVPGHGDQFGGAIKAVGWHNGTETGVSRVYAYDYDEKYQLSQANFGEMTGTGNFSFAQSLDNAHQVTVPGYDKHGNIQSLNRKGSVGNVLGDYDYHYKQNSNQLTSIDHLGSPMVSYEYDAIGRTVVQTEGAKTMKMVYDAYGMVKEIRDENDYLKVKFRYDDRGTRVCKEVFDADGTLALRNWYVRDAAGNVLSIYQEDVAGGLAAVQNEVPIYGGDSSSTRSK